MIDNKNKKRKLNSEIIIDSDDDENPPVTPLKKKTNVAIVLDDEMGDNEIEYGNNGISTTVVKNNSCRKRKTKEIVLDSDEDLKKN